jgi:hypothetical protein
MDAETARAISDIRAETVALRAAVKIVLRRMYGMGDAALGVIREDVLAAVESAIRDARDDDRQQYFYQAVREAVQDLLTPLPR